MEEESRIGKGKPEEPIGNGTVSQTAENSDIVPRAQSLPTVSTTIRLKRVNGEITFTPLGTSNTEITSSPE